MRDYADAEAAAGDRYARPLTPDVALQAAARLYLYRGDFALFARHELKIQTKEAGSPVKPLILRPFQDRLYRAILKQQQDRTYVRQAWLKGRQVGSSTLAMAVTFWRTVLFDNVNSIVVAHDEGTAEKLFQMVQRFYDRMTPALRPMVRYRTKGSIEFENPNAKDRLVRPGRNSRLTIATAKNIHSGAGGTYHNVVLSEVCRYPYPEEIVASTLQAVPALPDTYVFVESTARPEGHWFYNLCLQAQIEDPENPYAYQFISWLDDPTCVEQVPSGRIVFDDGTRRLDRMTPTERHLVDRYGLTPEQLVFRRVKLAGEFMGDELLFGQEYPLEFQDAWVPKGYQVWPRDQLALVAELVTGPLYHADIGAKGELLRAADGPLAVWEEPQPGVLYDIGVDTAMGLEDGDWSVACVIRRDTREQVAELRLKAEPTIFVDLIESLGFAFNTAQVNVEVNGASGFFVNAELTRQRNYPNLYIWEKPDLLVPRLTKYTGFETNRRTKRQIVSIGKDFVYRWAASPPPRTPLIRSEILHEEMRTYVRLPGPNEVYGAAPGSHDDTVIAWLLALIAARESAFSQAPSGLPEESRPPDWSRHEAYQMTAREAGLPSAVNIWGDLDGWR